MSGSQWSLTTGPSVNYGPFVQTPAPSAVEDPVTQLRRLASLSATLGSSPHPLLSLPESISDSLNTLVDYFSSHLEAPHSFDSNHTPSTPFNPPLAVSPDTDILFSESDNSHSTLSRRYTPSNPTLHSSLPSTSSTAPSLVPVTCALPSPNSALTAPSTSSHALPSTAPFHLIPDLSRTSVGPVFEKNNVRVTTKLTLAKLYRISEPNYTLEYPKTSPQGIGYLMKVLPSTERYNPSLNMAYSVGKPSRGFSNKCFVEVEILTDASGRMVPCQVSYVTCQGIKACPRFDSHILQLPHMEASREALRIRLEGERTLHTVSRVSGAGWELRAKIQERTLAYFHSVMAIGCGSPPLETTIRSEEEKEAYEAHQSHLELGRRGHSPKPTCDGRIMFYGGPTPHVRCEHYDRTSNKDHFVDLSLGNGRYDLMYLEALFSDKRDLIEDVEDDLALLHRTGPLAPCTFTMNVSSIRVHCPVPHRDDNGVLQLLAMEQVECTCAFRVYAPTEEYREVCPWVLLISIGVHNHPIPMLARTPPVIVSELCKLLRSMVDDLPDLTPRRFLRHPTMQCYLSEKLGATAADSPQLSDVHPSLSNRDHLRSYIDRVKDEVFPHGTGWKGLLHLKKQQDESGTQDPYLRYMAEIVLTQHGSVSSDEIEDPQTPLRIAICMTPESSRCLRQSKNVQFDISFKRVTEFVEFVLGAEDSESKMNRVLSRIYVTKQDAPTHELMFQKLDDIVRLDTGEGLRWRHIHSSGLSNHEGICLVTIDQHQGQAKGFGMYLKGKAKLEAPRCDLHEPGRLLQDLSEYDHTRRIARLCTNHLYRNIQGTATSKEVKRKMQSLICMTHPSWEATIAEIRAEGGTAANNCVDDKIQSKFAFPAMCWEMSFVPKEIWQLGERTTNLIEALHADANHEGISCTLVGGFLKGKHFDLLKEKTAKSVQLYGVQPSHKLSNEPKKLERGLKRKNTMHSKMLDHEDTALQKANKKLRTASDTLTRRAATFNECLTSGSIQAAEKACLSAQRARSQYDAALSQSISLANTGSGKVGLLLPLDAHDRLAGSGI